MKFLIYLIGPTAMIFTGLQIFSSIPLTFLVFYGWLIAVPLINKEGRFYEKGNSVGRSLLIGLVSGFIFFLFIVGGLNWLHGYFIDIDYLADLLDQWGFSGNGVILLVLVLLVINPILEEFYWREFMHVKLKSKFTAFHTVWITSFFYALYHFLSVIPMFERPLNIVAVLPVFIAGVFWGYIREKTGTIIGTIVSHALGDLGIMFVYWFIVR
ncbi:CPBP family intramembrane glutamic endopeptidase [Pseudalkalibacillus caeni]|uniref:CPBP family intramembrane metalloprotease n=1 Tax=Exobacillus caeni TaxID=2574798 RepID=A0A5R9F7W3_9BACL|nr:type II CAAX endopeptidase family protein [Pseudalkalibacillus caeni]TLS36933.1 CPBP family intramembrane metalloprotease [Pseudalkalibacillus caeni]